MFPRWLSWLIVLMLAYIILQGSRAKHEVLPTASAPVTEAATAPAPAKPLPPSLAKATDLERWKKAINPEYAARTQCELKAEPGAKPELLWKVTQEEQGDGKPAGCGETIQLNLTVWNAKGGVAWRGEMPFALGSREIAAGLDAALLGIRPKGERTVIIGPAALTRAPNAVAPKALLNALGRDKVVLITAERLEDAAPAAN